MPTEITAMFPRHGRVAGVYVSAVTTSGNCSAISGDRNSRTMLKHEEEIVVLL